MDAWTHESFVQTTGQIWGRFRRSHPEPLGCIRTGHYWYCVIGHLPTYDKLVLIWANHRHPRVLTSARYVIPKTASPNLLPIRAWPRIFTPQQARIALEIK